MLIAGVFDRVRSSKKLLLILRVIFGPGIRFLALGTALSRLSLPFVTVLFSRSAS